jgi:hypothetical protein
MHRTLVVLLLLLLASPASAQNDETRVFDGAGAIGGALVAAEATLLVEAALGVEAWWAYAIGGVLAGGAGALIGARVDRDAEPEIANGLASVGFALVIPTSIWLGNALEPRPPNDSRRPIARRRALWLSF